LEAEKLAEFLKIAIEFWKFCKFIGVEDLKTKVGRARQGQQKSTPEREAPGIVEKVIVNTPAVPEE